jgi:triacylglycerol esterase/lipase EstA (alpha/beta hydrolase family)
MGGLAVRRYLADRGASRVAKVVTLASPHAGTILSAFGLGRNAAQMRVDSGFLEALRRAEEGRAPCPFTSIYSLDDNMVSPQDTSRLGWARNVPLHAVGHITILQSRRTYSTLLNELTEAGAGPN